MTRKIHKQLWLRQAPKVRQDFFEDFNKKFPLIGDDKFLRKFLWEIIESAINSEDDIYFHNMSYKAILEPLKRMYKVNISTYEIIDILSKSIPESYVTRYSIEDKNARKIVVKKEIAKDIFNWWLSYSPGDLYVSSTKEKYGSDMRSKITKWSREFSKEILDTEFPYNNMLEDLNLRKKMPQIFFDNAKKVTNQLFNDKSIEEEEYNKIILAIENAKNPVYFNKKNRLYMQGVSLQGIKSKYRHLLTPKNLGFYELDLKCAHLSFFAAISNSRIMQGYLSEGSVWDILEKDTGISKNTVNNIGLKDRINPCLYCLPEQMNYFLAGKSDNIDESSQKLLNHPFIKEFIKRKHKIFNLIKNEGYLIDALGNFVEGSYEQILHMVCNSYELYLINFIYKAQKENGYRVTIHQHDGCTIYFNDYTEENALSVLNILKNKIEKEARKINVITSLDWKN